MFHKNQPINGGFLWIILCWFLQMISIFFFVLASLFRSQSLSLSRSLSRSLSFARKSLGKSWLVSVAI